MMLKIRKSITIIVPTLSDINEFADLTLYVIKANYLDKRMLHIPEKMNKFPKKAKSKKKKY